MRTVSPDNACHRWCRTTTAVCTAIGMVCTTACINEDLSDCGADMALLYDLQLELNLHTNLRMELSTEQELPMADRLEEALKDVFTNHAQLLSLHFYNANNGQPTLDERHHIDSHQAEFTLYISPGSYQHAAWANTTATSNLTLLHTDRYNSMTAMQATGDTIEGHSTGLFATRRSHFTVEAYKDQHFSQRLDMQNAAVALVLEFEPGQQPTHLSGCIDDMAQGFRVADSTFLFGQPQVIRTRQIHEGNLSACYAVCFPSADQPALQRGSDLPQGTIWRMEAFITMPDGKTAHNVIGVTKPLRAGTIKVIKAKVDRQGEVTSADPDVGVSVELDWNNGGNHEVEI